MRDPPDAKTLAAFIGATVTGGANFIAVSVSNMELPPLFGAALRFALASALFFLIAASWRVPIARGRAAAGAALYGVLGIGAAYAFLYYSLVGLAAGTVAVIIAAAPLFTILIAVVSGQERLSRRRLAGGVLAVAGIAVLSIEAMGGEIHPSYFAAAVLGSLAIAASSVVAKALPQVHPVNMNAIGMTAGIILLAMGSLVLGERWALPSETRTLFAVAWLVVIGSVGLFLSFLYVIRRWAASAAVFAVAAMPVVAVVLGVLILGQPVTGHLLAGGAIVTAGVYVGAIAR